VWGASRYVSTAIDFGMNPFQWCDIAPLNYGHALISPIYWTLPFNFPRRRIHLRYNGLGRLILGE
jgi:hypothetical protein